MFARSDFTHLYVALTFALLLAANGAAHAVDRAKPDTKVLASKLKEQVSEYMCLDAGKWLECFSLEAKNCRTIVTQFVDPCVNEAIDEVADAPNEEVLQKGAAKMAACFNRVFLGKYGLNRRTTPECVEPPQHLR